MKDMRKHTVGFIALALVTLFGCSQPKTFGGVPRKVVYKTIVSLSPSATEVLSNSTIKLAGRTKADNYPITISSVPVYGDLKP
jgi:hypothetical protein